MYSFMLSLVTVLVFIGFIIYRLIAKLKQGIIYGISFNDEAKHLTLNLVNEYSGEEFSKIISYDSLSIIESKQKIEIKSELTLFLLENGQLINVLRIAKSEWTTHPKIVQIVDQLRQVYICK